MMSLWSWRFVFLLLIHKVWQFSSDTDYAVDNPPWQVNTCTYCVLMSIELHVHARDLLLIMKFGVVVLIRSNLETTPDSTSYWFLNKICKTYRKCNVILVAIYFYTWMNFIHLLIALAIYRKIHTCTKLTSGLANCDGFDGHAYMAMCSHSLW